MDPAKTVRWVAIFVAGVVVVMGAAMIYTVVSQLRKPAFPQAQTNSAASALAAQPAVAEAAPPQESVAAPSPDPEVYQPQAAKQLNRDSGFQTKAVPRPPRTDAAAILPSPGTPRPQTPDMPMSGDGPPIPADTEPATNGTRVGQPGTSAGGAIPTRHTITLSSGTPLNVNLSQTISTDQAKKGQFFTGVLTNSIIRDGFIIAQAGSSVSGEVLLAKRGGFFGRRPELKLVLIAIRTTDNQAVRVETNAWEDLGRGHNPVTSPFRSAIGAVGAHGSGTLTLPANTTLQFRLAAPISITENTH